MAALSTSAPASATASATTAPSSRARFRRALVLMLMTLVLPGSAQLVAGNRKIGRIALRVWFGLLATLLLLFLLGSIVGSFVFWLLGNLFVLGVVRFGLIALAVGWAWLFVDAWRLGDPLSLRRKQRLAVTGLNGFLCFSVVGTLLFASHIVGVQKDLFSSLFTSNVVTGAHGGRYNVLLLGGDSGADRWGLRPDSISVASIDASTGKTVLFGLPRNMLNFPFAPGSVMHEQFPDGYTCGNACELNSLATWAADHKDLFKGYGDPGVEATKEAVEGITGLKINYYAMVNLAGFQKLVDAVGGVTLNVRDRIPIGGIGSPISGYIPSGVRKLNGFQTLWFARSRVAADDYSRMARQKCVLNAMLQQLSPQTVLLKFQQIADASKSLITTDVPESEVDRFMHLAVKARQQPVRTVSFVPPLISTGNPDIAKIQSTVKRAITRSEGDQVKPGAPAQTARARPQAPADTSTGSAPTTTGGSIGNLQDGYAANQAQDLSAVC